MWDSIEQAIRQIKTSFENANNHQSKLTKNILKMEGMTGKKTRHFYNNLLEHKNKLNYLEIGVWRGSSFTSAMYKNTNVTGLAVDDFNPNYGGRNSGAENYNLFLKNTNFFLTNEEKYDVLVKEFYKIEPEKLPKFDVYLYDGDHIEHFQYNAFKKMYSCFADICVIVIDDYNATSVQEGTERAKKELGVTIPFKIIYETDIKYTNDGSHTPIDIAEKEFWNGIYVCVLERIK
jgi:hypothetical protein